MHDYRSRIYAKYASHFTGESPQFDRVSAERWGRPYETFLRGWLPKEKDAEILDVACGSGRLLHFFVRRGYPNVTGVDISEEQLAIAKQVTERVVRENVSDFLERHENHFDLITGFDILEHLYKDEAIRFLDGCYKALKPGGRLVLQTPNSETPWGLPMRYGDFTHEVVYQASGLGKLLSLIEFVDVEARETGPVPLGLRSTVRTVMWRIIRMGLKSYNLIETGHAGSGVLTRVFLISAIKRRSFNDRPMPRAERAIA